MTEIKIKRNDLLGMLLRCQYGINRKKFLPILGDFLFRLNGSRMEVAAYNGDDTVITDAAEVLEVVDNGVERREWCVDGRYILKAVKSLDEQVLTITVMDYQLKICHSCGTMYLPVDDASEHPIIDKVILAMGETNSRMTLEVPGLRHWLEMARCYCAQDELRPVMNGVFLEITSDNMILTASDGHKLINISKAAVSDWQGQVIIPRKVCNILLKVLPRAGMVDFYFNQEENNPRGRFSVVTDTEKGTVLDILFACTPGRYPNWRSVIPQNFSLFLTVDRQQMTKALDRIMLFVNSRRRLCRFLFMENGRLEISAEDLDFSLSGTEELEYEMQGSAKMSGSMLIGFNAIAMASVLNHTGSRRVLFKLQDSSRAVIIQPEPQPDVEEVTMLIMPMLVSD